ncbi:MAG: glutamate-1-semialdehyde 2,1-aminomutase [Lachnospiraceae bacterium]
MTRSQQLFEEAKKYIPGGVNSPVRAFGSIGSYPRFMEKADGPFLWDADGRRYIDFIGSWGPMLLGQNQKEVRDSVVAACQNGLSFGAATEIEVTMAKLICSIVPSVEMVRMVNSGTEATMSAIRVARGYTRRDKIVKFAGCYHGHSDCLLVKAGSGVMTSGVPDSAGVPKGCAEDTLTAVYNDLESVKELFQKYGEQIAAIIVEPVAANMGVVLPEPGFLQGLRQICDEYGSLLIFDEVITGFRLALDGAQGLFGIKPDLTTFGKIIGAGMPVGAYGGRREIMELVAPLGPVYQAGTLSGNPVAMAAGVTHLTILKEHPEYYAQLQELADDFFMGMEKRIRQKHLPCQVNHIGALGCLYFSEKPVKNYENAKASDTQAFSKYCNAMLDQGVYLAPSQFEAIFISKGHTKELLEQTLQIFDDVIGNIWK